MAATLFGLVPAGQPLLTEPSSIVSETSLLFTLPRAPFSHIVVFLLPGVILPPGTAAAIYHASSTEVQAAAAAGRSPNFQFLGGIGPGKESAIFKINIAGDTAEQVMGISIEPADSVTARIQELSKNKSVTGPPKVDQPTTLVLAQRIIQNAFNFLTSYSGTAGPGGVEVVPVKAFENWWKKFESRVRSDPSFLERSQD
jgi:hypothetical protein